MNEKLEKIKQELFEVIFMLNGKNTKASIILHKLTRQLNELIQEKAHVSKKTRT
jgi:hypothetical protein